jgi:hypothetical protein
MDLKPEELIKNIPATELERMITNLETSIPQSILKKNKSSE